MVLDQEISMNGKRWYKGLLKGSTFSINVLSLDLIVVNVHELVQVSITWLFHKRCFTWQVDFKNYFLLYHPNNWACTLLEKSVLGIITKFVRQICTAATTI